MPLRGPAAVWDEGGSDDPTVADLQPSRPEWTAPEEDHEVAAPTADWSTPVDDAPTIDWGTAPSAPSTPDSAAPDSAAPDASGPAAWSAPVADGPPEADWSPPPPPRPADTHASPEPPSTAPAGEWRPPPPSPPVLPDEAEPVNAPPPPSGAITPPPPVFRPAETGAPPPPEMPAHPPEAPEHRPRLAVPGRDESVGGPARADQGVRGWNPDLPPIPGVPDSPRPATSTPTDGGDGIPRTTLIRIAIGAAVIFVLGIVLLSAMGGGDSDEAAPGADGDEPDGGSTEPSIPFEVPPVPEDDGLPTEAVVVPPEDWDPVVRDLIPFIEEHRNLRFQEPVEVRLLSTQELFDEFGRMTDDPFVEQAIRDQIAIYRGMGIYQGDIDVGAFLAQADTIGITGLYDPIDDIVYVNRDVGAQGEPGASPFQRAVLLHELTHALQDQTADLGDPVGRGLPVTMRQMMVEGDARRIERQYAASLPPGEYDQYWSTMNGLLNPEGFNGVLGVESDFIYEGGMAVTRLVQALDSSASIDLLLQYPPDRPGQLLRASSLFLHGQEPWAGDVGTQHIPATPPDGLPIGGGRIGAWTWYVAFATRLDPVEALRAADAIGGDVAAFYEDPGGRLCGVYELEATDTGGTGHLLAATRDWAAALPFPADVSVDYHTVRITTCDPGVGTAMNFARTPDDVVDGPIARLAAVADVLELQRGWWVEEELKENERWCLAESVQRAIGVEEALAGVDEARAAALGEAAVEACLPRRVPGGPPPIEGACSAAGLEPQLDDAGLPPEVAAARRTIVEAAVACDYDALQGLFAQRGPYLVDSVTGPPSSSASVVDRWIHREEQNERVMAGLVTALSSGWLCGPSIGAAIEGRDDGGCAFVSGGTGVVEDRAFVAILGMKGRLFGFGSNGPVVDTVLETWAGTITGDVRGVDYTQSAAGLGRKPKGWPIGVPPAVLLAED